MIALFVVDSKDRLMICAGSVREKKLDKLLEKVWNGKKREKNNSQGQREKKIHLTLSLSSIVLYI